MQRPGIPGSGGNNIGARALAIVRHQPNRSRVVLHVLDTGRSEGLHGDATSSTRAVMPNGSQYLLNLRTGAGRAKEGGSQGFVGEAAVCRWDLEDFGGSGCEFT